MVAFKTPPMMARAVSTLTTVARFAGRRPIHGARSARTLPLGHPGRANSWESAGSTVSRRRW
jgi:hypothetical protein